MRERNVKMDIITDKIGLTALALKDTSWAIVTNAGQKAAIIIGVQTSLLSRLSYSNGR